MLKPSVWSLLTDWLKWAPTEAWSAKCSLLPWVATCDGKSEENTEMKNDVKTSCSYYLTINHDWFKNWLLLSERLIWLDLSPLYIHVFAGNFAIVAVVTTWYHLTCAATSFDYCSYQYIEMILWKALLSFMWPYLALYAWQQTQNTLTGRLRDFSPSESLGVLLYNRKLRNSFHILSSH